jgi:hypothetical protein
MKSAANSDRNLAGAAADDFASRRLLPGETGGVITNYEGASLRERDFAQRVD